MRPDFEPLLQVGDVKWAALSEHVLQAAGLNILLALVSLDKTRHEKETLMARRFTGKMSGEKFLANSNTNQVHDLDNEKTGSNECQIDEIIAAGHEVPFKSLVAAHGAGYQNCDFCL